MFVSQENEFSTVRLRKLHFHINGISGVDKNPRPHSIKTDDYNQ